MAELSVGVMFDAIQEGNIDTVKRCLAAGINPNEEHKKVSALYWAARWEGVEVVRLLISGGARLDRPERHYSALRGALLGDNFEIARFLLDKKADADVTSIDIEGNTALHQEACRGTRETVQLLLDNGATVDAHNDRGETPLQIAAECGNPDIVILLTQAGANPHLKNHEGLTPRELAHRYDYSNIENLLLTYETQWQEKNRETGSKGRRESAVNPRSGNDVSSSTPSKPKASGAGCGGVLMIILLMACAISLAIK